MKSDATVQDRKSIVTGRSLRALALAVMLCVVTLVATGCTGMGETRAEAKRRHSRVLHLGTRGFGEDVDMALMLDRPSRLTEMRLP